MANNMPRLSLKVWNCLMGVGGIATVIYAIFMFKAGAETFPHQITIPWFLHGFLFVGIVLCAVSCLGHLAANTTNTCCLSTYIAIILLLLVLETLLITQAFLDPNWAKGLPVNESNMFDDSSVSSYIYKGLASLVFLVQAICALLAALSIHLTDRVDGYESEYEDEEPDLYSLASAAERNII